MPTNDILIGIDLGTTILKAAALDGQTGKSLAVAGRRLTVHAGADGRREEDLGEVDAVLEAVIRALRAQLGGAWRRVRGIGLAAQGGSFIICDLATGAPLTPMRLWNDQRPVPHAARIAALKPVSYWKRLAMNTGPGLGLARMVWLREREPRLFRHAHIYVGAGEYAFFKLTGQWRQDPGNALQIGCYDVRHRRLDPAPLALVDVSPDFVAPMREGHTTLPLAPATARRWRLSPGVAVAGPYFDHEAGYLSAVGVSRRPLQCSLGTAWVGNFELPRDTRWHSPNQLVVPAADGDGWLVVQPLLTGNVTWDWALATFLDADHRAALRRAGALFKTQLLPPPGMVALPWMNLLNPLQAGALGAGGFFGGGVAADRADYLRAIAVGMSCEMARVFQHVRDRRRVDSVVLGGGASKGAAFRTLLAALFAPVPVYALKEEDLTGPRGCLFAFNRRVASGAAQRVPVPARENLARIREAYAVYAEIFRRVLGKAAAPITFF